MPPEPATLSAQEHLKALVRSMPRWTRPILALLIVVLAIWTLFMVGTILAALLRAVFDIDQAKSYGLALVGLWLTGYGVVVVTMVLHQWLEI